MRWIHGLGGTAVLATLVTVGFWPGSRGQAREGASPSIASKQVVEAFEKLAFDEGKPAEAVRRYFSRDVRDHGQRIVGDYESIIALLEQLDWSKGNGPKRTVHHIVAEGDMVMVHHHLVRTPGTPGISAVDIFRVRDGKIVEHWEALQDLPANSPNKFGAF